ncbi:MAG: cell envelope integrity protein TolA [Gammaproteobacteria bacterium]
MGWATGLHVALLVVLSVSFSLSRPPIIPPQITIKATVVDEGAIRAERAREREAERAVQRRREEEAAQVRREAEQEQQRLDQLRIQQEQAAETARQQRVAEERERQAIEQERQRKEAAAAEARRKAEEAKQREAQRLAEEKRQAAERRQAEERRKQEEAARRQAALEADLARELEAEESRLAAARSGELAQYIALIQQRVTRNWIRPPEARPGLSCELYVTQIPGGEVVGVRFGRCNGDDVVRRSIEAAVFKASPLPRPSNPALFERNLVFEFKPE